jgi:hypothetical protein
MVGSGDTWFGECGSWCVVAPCMATVRSSRWTDHVATRALSTSPQLAQTQLDTGTFLWIVGAPLESRSHLFVCTWYEYVCMTARPCLKTSARTVADNQLIRAVACNLRNISLHLGHRFSNLFNSSLDPAGFCWSKNVFRAFPGAWYGSKVPARPARIKCKPCWSVTSQMLGLDSLGYGA